MGWRIVNGKKYFYDVYRHGGRVIARYLGRGPDAQREAEKLEQRHKVRRARQRALANLAKLKKLGEETFSEIDLLLWASLVTAGFYRHSGQWRRRRYTVPKERPFFEPPPPPPTTFKEMVRRANLGEELALATLREYLIARPHLWKQVGDVAFLAREARIRRIAGGNAVVAESIRMRLESMRANFTSPQPSQIEELAVEGLLGTWLELHQLELVSQYKENQSLQSQCNKAHTAATRRFYAALGAYWMVRGNLPVVRRVSEELLNPQNQEESGQVAVVPTSLAEATA